jgi:hypothetical protein
VLSYKSVIFAVQNSGDNAFFMDQAKEKILAKLRAALKEQNSIPYPELEEEPQGVCRSSRRFVIPF